MICVRVDGNSDVKCAGERALGGRGGSEGGLEDLFEGFGVAAA